MQSEALNLRRAGLIIGFVPTMGYLHEGHLSLIRLARSHLNGPGVVVVSIYVNPTQFAPHEDFHQYPRDLERDLILCKQEKVDYVFAPSDEEMYPSGYSTYVIEENLSIPMEGKARPTHFKGVTTIVTKLFNIVQPHFAVFGAKDYQQAMIIKKMVKDLNFPIDLIIGPTVRESDGLALSSRNVYLTPTQRRSAVCLYRAIQLAKEIVNASPSGISAQELRVKLEEFIHSFPETKVDYIEFFDPQTLKPQQIVSHGVHMALAVYIGSTRLIDNEPL